MNRRNGTQRDNIRKKVDDFTRLDWSIIQYAVRSLQANDDNQRTLEKITELQQIIGPAEEIQLYVAVLPQDDEAFDVHVFRYINGRVHAAEARFPWDPTLPLIPEVMKYYEAEYKLIREHNNTDYTYVLTLEERFIE